MLALVIAYIETRWAKCRMRIDPFKPPGESVAKRAPISVRMLIFRNKLLILFHKALYGFYLCRKRLLLPLHRRRMRLSLLNCEREFVAKYGCDWRLRVFDDEVVKFLKMREYVHRVLWPSDD